MSTSTEIVTNGHVQATGHLKLPAFPLDIPTAPIATISLSKLVSNDENEATRVLEACRTHGFFYLDLTDHPSGKPLLEGSEAVVEMAKSVFDLPLEEKQGYACNPAVSLMGYKHAGTIKQTDKHQRPDTTEFMSVSKDHIHGLSESRTYPQQIGEANPTLRTFTKGAHQTGMVVLSTLARRLGVAEDAFTSKNIFGKNSEDNMRMTKKMPHDESSNKIGLVSHTDFGSITLLWNWLGGLQIQSRDPSKQGEWEYVKPVPGACIVNLGDATVKFTDGILKSAKHRVVNAPGDQKSVDRYSVVYFVRPNNDALMQPVEGIRDIGLEKVDVSQLFDEEEQGKVYTALEWQQRRTVNLQGQNKPSGD